MTGLDLKIPTYLQFFPRLSKLYQNGVIKKIIKKWTRSSAKKVDCLNPETDSGTPIDFKTVVVAFIILAVSFSIAFLILIFERIFHKRKKIS